MITLPVLEESAEEEYQRVQRRTKRTVSPEGSGGQGSVLDGGGGRARSGVRRGYADDEDEDEANEGTMRDTDFLKRRSRERDGIRSSSSPAALCMGRTAVRYEEGTIPASQLEVGGAPRCFSSRAL